MKNINTVKRQAPSKNSADFFETQDSTIDVLWDNYLKDTYEQLDGVYDFCAGRCSIVDRIEKRYGWNINNTINSDIERRIDRGYIQDMFDVEFWDPHHVEWLEAYADEDGYEAVEGYDFDEELGYWVHDGTKENHLFLGNKPHIHIVMNPPFKRLTETIEYYLKLKKKYPAIKSLCLLHSVRALEGQERHKIMEELGYPSLILNMSKRQSFNTYFGEEKRTWTPPFSVCWSIWDDNYEGKTEFRYVGG